MPELPEVETIRRGLSKLIIGKEIISVESNWAKSFSEPRASLNAFVLKSKIVRVKRRAKILIVELSSGYSLLIHLKMTGQVVYRGKKESFGAGHPSSSLSGELPDKSTRVVFTFKDNSKLFFNDQRKFGWIKLVPSPQLSSLALLSKLGPEPLSPGFTPEVLKRQFQKRARSSIKAALLDQSVVAGIGNIYADESLWGAKIYPGTLTGVLSDRKIQLLTGQIISILKLSLRKGGSSDKNYVNAEGKMGSYLAFARVFRREGLPCPRCGHIIRKIRVANRGTHYCPHCQRPPRK